MTKYVIPNTTYIVATRITGWCEYRSILSGVDSTNILRITKIGTEM